MQIVAVSRTASTNHVSIPQKRQLFVGVTGVPREAKYSYAMFRFGEIEPDVPVEMRQTGARASCQLVYVASITLPQRVYVPTVNGNITTLRSHFRWKRAMPVICTVRAV